MSKPNKSALELPSDPLPQQVIAVLTEAFNEQTEDTEYQSLISTAVPGISPTYGIRVPMLRGMAKEILLKYKDQTITLDEIAQESWGIGTREHKLIALFIYDGLEAIRTEARWAIGIRFLPDVYNWEECDQLCMAIFGRVIVEDPSVMDELERWTEDPNFWVRRAALVTTVYLRNAKFDELQSLALDQRSLGLCAALLDDDEKYIRKAVDWTIRAVIARHEELAYRWIMDRTKGTLSNTARSTLKLASKKLIDDHRAEFMGALGS